MVVLGETAGMIALNYQSCAINADPELEQGRLIMDWEISTYRLQVSEKDRDPITVELAVQTDGSRRWAIRYRGLCLSRKGVWEWEPQPSSRSKRWISQHRWASVKKAQGVAEKARVALLEEYPHG